MSERSELPPEAHAASLASLDRLTPSRLASLLRAGPWSEVWRMVAGEIAASPEVARLAGSRPGLADAWRASARSRCPETVWESCQVTGTEVVVMGSERYPALLSFDPLPAPVLFVRGDLGALDGRRAGIVGTRNPTEGGRRLAMRLGRELADAGVSVVSGLARGIDGCAHVGALASTSASAAAPIAVVASGPDVPYPREHLRLWRDVVEQGVLISEHPPGSPPLAEWFPLRNRIIAGLSEVVVVVESRARGGSLITVREAEKRQVGVLAVPGSLLNRAAEGTNRLIADGGQAVLDVLDVLVALGIDTKRAGRRAFDARPAPTAEDRRVLDAFDGDALNIDEIACRTAVPLVQLALSIGRLEAGGWLRDSGGWYEPVDAGPRLR